MIVQVQGFRSQMEIEAGPDGKGRYLLVHGNMKVWTHQSKIKESKVSKTKTKIKTAKQNLKINSPRSKNQESKKLDFHGITVSEAIKRLEEAIDHALIDGTRMLEIVHGIGTGKIKEAVHQYLKECKQVSRFKTHDSNRGVTLVYL